MADLSLESVELEIIEILRESGLDFSSLDLVEETLRATGKAGDDIFSPESSEILYHLFELRSALRTNPDFLSLADPAKCPDRAPIAAAGQDRQCENRMYRFADHRNSASA